MFRKTLFWLHLVAGLLSGLSIAIMCFTGTVLAFEKQLVAWSERDARQISPPPAGATRLPLDELPARLLAARPDARPQNIVVTHDPLAAVAFSSGGRGGGATVYVNPYTGEVRTPASTAATAFMRTMTDWHRTLAFTGEQTRPVGKLINGICNLAFFVLAVTGLFLWLPRAWSWRTVSPILWFRAAATAKARDFNWHNVIGFWTAPVLIVLTLTAVPISFRWGGTLISTLTGTPTSAENSPGPRGGPAAPAITVSPPSPAAAPLAPDALLAAVQRQTPAWQTLTFRTTALERSPAKIATPASTSALTVTVRESTSWPRTATTTLSVNPFTGEILRRTGYADQPAAQQVRGWTRFLHTGEALGPVGQFVAGLACLGGLFLVYTGVALSVRRFFPRTAASSRPTSSPA